MSIATCQTNYTHIFEEDFENTTGLLIDETRNTLDTTTTGKTADSGLCDTYTTVNTQNRSTKWNMLTLDVITENLTVTLGTTLSKALGNSVLASQSTHQQPTNTPFHLFHGQTLFKK